MSKSHLKQNFLDNHLTTFFRVCNFEKTSSMRVIFLLKMFKIWCRFQICSKKLGKSVCFWEKCISIGGIKLSLLRREYMSLAVNLWTKSLKSFHITKGDFSNSIAFTVISNSGKGAVVQIATVFRPVYHVACPTLLWNETF